ncbi:MAG: NAD(P)H-quinone oxidoreductase subunit J, chloroplastic [Acidimicrobiales bacterium]|nr:NAD(P)H-quinone oxidoreductase subunit J, chloroplastic [Acidimicrobiales bacterium]
MPSVDATDERAESADPEAESAEPDERREAVVAGFAEEFGEQLVGSHIEPDREVWVRVAADAWRAAGEYARHHLRCRYFEFLAAIDWMPSPFGRSMDAEVDNAAKEPEPAAVQATPRNTGATGGETRFQVFARVAHVHDHDYWGVVLKADVGDGPDDLTIDSWVPVYAGANWHEREAWEMYGIEFTGHPGLRHLYLPSGFEGRPLRKDFPLLPRIVKPWPGIVDVEAMPGEETDVVKGDDRSSDEADQPEDSDQ